MTRFARIPSLLVLGLVALLAAATPGRAQNDPVQFGQGTHAFRYVLYDLDFTALEHENDVWDAPARTILVVFGETDLLARMRGPLVRHFVESGGALFVATDRIPKDPGPLAEFGVTLQGQVVMRNGDLARCYRQLPDCPIVEATGERRPSLFQGLRLGVATNRPAFLAMHRPPNGTGLKTLALLPKGCQPSIEAWPNLPPISRAFAAGYESWGDGAGRVLVLADHSIFINDMLLQTDNNNIDFTYNCLEWLRDGPVKRDRVLFVDEGTIVPDFKVAMKEMPLPPIKPPPDLLGKANDLLVGMGEDDVYNKLILSESEREQQRRLGIILRVVAVVLTLGLVGYAFLRLSRARHRIEYGTPLLAPTLEKLAPVETPVEQRHDALLRDGNLVEPARVVARQFLEWAIEARASGESPPKLSFRGGWGQRRKLRASVLRLWQIAYAATPGRVSQVEFAGLSARVAEVRTALERGILRFE